MRTALVLVGLWLLPAVQEPPGRAEALARLQKAREAATREVAERKERDARVGAILKEQTEKQPLRLDLGGGTVIDKVKAASYDGGRVKLVFPQGTVEYPLETLPAAARATLLNGILDRGTPRDQFEVGRLLVRTGDLDLGKRCLEKAAGLDASLKPLAPDIERLRVMARPFEASFSLFGSQLQATWTFKRPEEAKDFTPGEKGQVALAAGGGLTVSGPSYAPAFLREAAFRDRLKVSAVPVETAGNAHLLGVEFTTVEGSTVFIYVAALTKLKALIVNRLEGGQTATLVEPVPMRAGARLEMEFARGKFTFRNGDKALWSGDEGGFLDVTLVLGALALKENGVRAETSSATFREVSLTGTVSPEWLKRRTLDYRAALQSELERERRVGARSGPAKEANLALTVDAELAVTAPPTYPAALGAVRRYLASGETSDYASASSLVVRLTEQNAPFAPGWYWRGMLEEDGGNRREAERLFGEALARKADFPEALCGKARVLALRGDDAAARPLVERAMALRPDLAEAHLLVSRLEHGAGRAAPALEAASVARHLAPEDDDVQSRAAMMRNVVRGPAWTQVGRHETANFAVLGDVPGARLRAYGEHLEAVRTHYMEMIGAPPAARAKKAEILVFASPEGYYSYLDITSGRRMESTLGVFNPWYGQMMIFEDADQEETLRVASHEGFHQYLNGVAQDVPQWFNEGMAEYAGAAGVKNGKLVERGNLQVGRLIDLLSGILRGWAHVPFAQIMVEPKASFYGKEASLKYAQAWSMIHFFMHGEKGKHRPLLKAYTERLLAGDSAAAAYQASFGGGDVRALETAWLAYVKSFLASGGGDAAVDLLKLVDLRQDQVRGTWRIAGGKLYSPPEQKGGQITGLRIPYAPPAEYDLTMVIERRENNKGPMRSIDIGLAGPGGLFAVVVDAGEMSFLNGLPGGSGSDPAAQWKGVVFDSAKPRTLVFAVRKGGVTLTVDGSATLQWRGDLSIVRQDYGMPDKSCLFLCTWLTYAVSKIELTPVSGRGRKIR